MSKLQIGDKVAYSATFLQSISCYTGDIPFARGIVTEIKPVGERQLITVDWGNEDIPSKVISGNLAKVGTPGMSAL